MGVRQRAWGKWETVIGDSFKAVRIWLGIFNTAKATTRVYDEATLKFGYNNTKINFLENI